MERLLARHEETEAHFTKYFGELLRIKLRARLRSAEMIEDVRQETFLRVFRALRDGSVQHPERIGAFVNAVCNNVLLEHLRSRDRHMPPPDDNIDYPDAAPTPDELAVSEERRQQVQKILAELPDKDRALIRAVFLMDEDKDEVCRRFHVDREYLRVLLHRARLKMRQQFRSAQLLRQVVAFLGL